MEYELYFMHHANGAVFAFNTEKDRDDAVYSAWMSHHSVSPVTTAEAFALVAPDRDGKRRFSLDGGFDVALDADWSPEQAAARIAEMELAGERRKALQDSSWLAKFGRTPELRARGAADLAQYDAT